MISNYVKVAVSYDVYVDPINSGLPLGWEIYSSAPDSSIMNAYYGRAYLNRNTGEVIIAHRGTNNIAHDGYADIQLSVDNLPTQFEKAKEFINDVKIKMLSDGLNSYNVSYTGHSLGGGLAQMSAAWDYANGNASADAVVFESPGITEEMLKDASVSGGYMVDGLPNDVEGPVDLNDLELINYVTSPNAVNTCNSHYARLVRVYPSYEVDENVLQSKLSLADDYTQYVGQQHSIAGILSEFDSRTGDARRKRDVLGWYEEGYEDYYKVYDLNKEYWDLQFDNAWNNNIVLEESVYYQGKPEKKVRDLYRSLGEFKDDYISKNLGGTDFEITAEQKVEDLFANNGIDYSHSLDIAGGVDLPSFSDKTGLSIDTALELPDYENDWMGANAGNAVAEDLEWVQDVQDTVQAVVQDKIDETVDAAVDFAEDFLSNFVMGLLQNTGKIYSGNFCANLHKNSSLKMFPGISQQPLALWRWLVLGRLLVLCEVFYLCFFVLFYW